MGCADKMGNHSVLCKTHYRTNPSKSTILIGVSFGGIMAVEVAKLIATEKVILISSAKTRHELSFYYRLAGILQFHKLLPARLLKYPNYFAFWLFGAKNQRDQDLLAAILLNTDKDFL